MSSKLPLGWTTINLFDVCRPSQWKTLSLSELFPKGYLVYGANGPIGFFDKYTHEDPTVMITCRGATCGNVHVSKPQSYINGNAMALDDLVIELCHLEYLENFLRIRGFDDVVSGSAQPQITQNSLRVVSIPLAPAAEQTRIVEKLEELLSDLDAGVAELKVAQKKLIQYRQSLLKAAVEGALTADWRKNQAAAPAESGAALLARILTERRNRWETRQLAKFQAQGKTPLRDWQAKYPEPVAPDAAGLPALPLGWVWTSLNQLVGDSSYGTSVKCSYESQGVSVLRIPNVVARKLVLDDLKYATEPLGLEESEYLAPGDILIVRTNGSIGLVGRAAEVSKVLPGQFYFASYLLRVRCIETVVMHRWVSAVLASSLGRKWIEARAASSAGLHNISLSTLLTIPIPLPPLVEQSESLQSLEMLLFSISQQEQWMDVSLKQSAAQRKNILQAAFSGQLVPQDPADEPASVLLARIRAERQERASLGKTKKLNSYLRRSSPC